MRWKNEPFHGNVRALQGPEWKAIFRRRLGSYRLIFMPDAKRRVVQVLRIVIRSARTYR